MKYTTGKTGRILVIRFDHGEEFLPLLEGLVRKEDIRAGIIYLLGAIAEGDVVTGPVKSVLPPESRWFHLDDTHELLGVGSVFWEKETPKIHTSLCIRKTR